MTHSAMTHSAMTHSAMTHSAMTHPDTFLHAILDNPDSNVPRLQYADWLDEQCNPLGEFIRVQCRLARLAARDPCLRELERREQELLAEFEDDWLGDLRDMVEWWVFRGGFVTEIALSGNQLRAHGAELFRRAPIREMHINGVADQTAALADSPLLTRTRHLDLSDNRLGDVGVQVLARSPHLGQLRGLNLSCTGVGDAGARALADAPPLDHLKELYVSNNRIGAAGGRALADSPHLHRLSRLFLDSNFIAGPARVALQQRFGDRVHFEPQE